MESLSFTLSNVADTPFDPDLVVGLGNLLWERDGRDLHERRLGTSAVAPRIGTSPRLVVPIVRHEIRSGKTLHAVWPVSR